MHQVRYAFNIAQALSFQWRKRLRSALTGETLSARAMRGSGWLLAGFGGAQVLRLASNLILTRLLFPETFGQMALVSVFLMGLSLLSDIGLDASIIQNPRGDTPIFLCTAWTLQVIRGFVLWLCTCLIAWPIGSFYADQSLMHMIPVSGLTILITGFQTTAVPLSNRRMQLRVLTLYQLLVQAFTAVATVSLAWQIKSAWALVLGGVLGAAFQTFLGYYLLPGIKHRFVIDRVSAAEITRFGRWLFAATAMGFLASQAADKLILAKLVSNQVLGVYSVAFMLAQLPAAIVTMLMGRILYASLAEVARQNNSMFETNLLFARNIVWRPLLLLVAALGFFGPALFNTLWDPQYSAAGWMLQVMLISVWFDGLNSSLNAALLSRGNSFASVVYNAAMMIVGMPSMLLGLTYGGIMGMILGMATGRLAAHIALHLMLKMSGIAAWQQDLKAHTIALLLAILVFACTNGHFNFPYVGIVHVGEVARGDMAAIAIATITLCSIAALCVRPLMTVCHDIGNAGLASK